MSNLSISAQLELRQSQNEMLELSNRPSLTTAEKRRFDALLAKISLLKSGAISDEVRFAEANQLRKEFGLAPVEYSEPSEERQYRTAFNNHILRGARLEIRTYQGMESIDTSLGGALCPQDYQRELFQDAGTVEPLLDETIVRFIRTKNGNPLTLPTVDMTELTSSIVAQNTDVPPVANPTASKVTFGAYSYRCTPVAVSNELQEDSFEPITAILQQCFSTAIANGAGADLISGSGTGAPQGLLTGATDSTITTALASAITGAEIESVYMALPRIHRINPRTAWVMSDAVYSMVRKAVDDNQRPLLNIVNDKEMLLGRRVLVSPSMDAKKFVLANLSQYVVRMATDAVRIRVAREAAGYAETNTSLLSCTVRLDGKLVQPASGVPVAVFGTIAAS